MLGGVRARRRSSSAVAAGRLYFLRTSLLRAQKHKRRSQQRSKGSQQHVFLSVPQIALLAVISLGPIGGRYSGQERFEDIVNSSDGQDEHDAEEVEWPLAEPPSFLQQFDLRNR